jgi:hypothetical protein
MRGSERISSVAYNKTGDAATKDSTTKSADADNVSIKGTSKIKKVANSRSIFSKIKNALSRKNKPLSDFNANIKSVKSKVVHSPTKLAYKENKESTKEYLQNQGYKGTELKKIMNSLKSVPNEYYSDAVRDIPKKEFQLLGYTSQKAVSSDFDRALTLLKGANFSNRNAKSVISHVRAGADKKNFRESFREIIDMIVDDAIAKQNHQQIGGKKKARNFTHVKDIFASTNSMKTNKSAKTQVEFSDKNQVIESDSADTPTFISKDVTSKQTPDLESTPKETNYNLDDSIDKSQQIKEDLAKLAEYTAGDSTEEIEQKRYNELAALLEPLPLSNQLEVLSVSISTKMRGTHADTLGAFLYAMLTTRKKSLPTHSQYIHEIVKYKFSANNIMNSLVKARSELTDSTQQGLDVIYFAIDQFRKYEMEASENKDLVDFLSQLSKEKVEVVLSDKNVDEYPEVAEIVRKHNPLAKGMKR